MQGTDLDSCIEVAATNLADVDRRILSIDAHRRRSGLARQGERRLDHE
jgi:hypothetical protein